ALGRHMGYDREKLFDLGLSAILYDIGKMWVPESILNKSEMLIEEEQREMRKHVIYGADILSDVEDLCEEAILVAEEHHERFDGNGYPRGRTGENLHIYSRIVSIADAYDAMTTVKAYGSSLPPSEALKKLFGLKKICFDSDLVERFVKCIGLYPVGSYVKLNSGEVAEIKVANREDLLRPIVTVLFDKNSKKCTKSFDIDLSVETAKNIDTYADIDSF
ncbi:MAG: HD-GYP domain-containing protein, partial [Thermodesulfobacteriota bacterium]